MYGTSHNKVLFCQSHSRTRYYFHLPCEQTCRIGLSPDLEPKLEVCDFSKSRDVPPDLSLDDSTVLCTTPTFRAPSREGPCPHDTMNPDIDTIFTLTMQGEKWPMSAFKTRHHRLADSFSTATSSAKDTRTSSPQPLSKGSRGL